VRRVRLALLALAAAPWTAAAAPAAPTPPPDPPARWLLTGPIHDPRTEHAATLLDDGRVLVCGGRTAAPGMRVRLLGSCEVWNPKTEHWTPAGSLPYPRANLAAVRLADDRVAFVGGNDYAVAGSSPDARSAVDVWDPRRNDAATVGLLPFRPSVRSPCGCLTAACS
jgi:Galactose oxidase, central domain